MAEIIVSPEEFVAFLDKMTNKDCPIEALGSTVTQDHPEIELENYDFQSMSPEELYEFLNDPRVNDSFVWTDYKITLPIGKILFTVQNVVALTDDCKNFYLISYQDRDWGGEFVNCPCAGYLLSYAGFSVQDPETLEFWDEEKMVEIIRNYFSDYAILLHWMRQLSQALNEVQ